MFDNLNPSQPTSFGNTGPQDAFAGITAPQGGTMGDTGMPNVNLVLDLENASTAVFEAIPPGVYDAVVENTEYGNSKAGNPMITVTFKLKGGDWDKRKMFTYYTLNQEFGVASFKLFLQRVTPEYPLSQFSPEKYCTNCVAVGRACRLKLTVKMYEGTRRNNVKEVLEAGTMDKFFS